MQGINTLLDCVESGQAQPCFRSKGGLVTLPQVKAC